MGLVSRLIKGHASATQDGLKMTLYHLGDYRYDPPFKMAVRAFFGDTNLFSHYRSTTRVGRPYGTVELIVEDPRIKGNPIVSSFYRVFGRDYTSKAKIKGGRILWPINLSPPKEVAGVLVDGLDLNNRLPPKLREEISEEMLEELVIHASEKLFPAEAGVSEKE